MLGCNSNKPLQPNGVKQITLKEVAQKEKELLPKVTVIHQAISEQYKKFEQGSINREEFNNQLKIQRQELDKIKMEADDYYSNHKISKKDSKNPIYDEGLISGQKMRSVLSTFINTAVDGRRMGKANTKDLNENVNGEIIIYDDSKIKSYYAKQEMKYQDHLAKLNTALDKFK